MEFHLLLVQLVFILPFLEHLSLSKFLEVIIIIGRLHLLFVDKLEMIPLDCFQGTYDFSKRNIKNQKLHKNKIENNNFLCPKKLEKKTFVFCRYAQNVTNVEALPYPETLPEFVPSHQSWAVTNALKDYAWTTKMLPSFVAIDMTDVYGDSHQHSNGTCAQIGWLSDTGYNTMDGQGNILSRTMLLKSGAARYTNTKYYWLGMVRSRLF